MLVPNMQETMLLPLTGLPARWNAWDLEREPAAAVAKIEVATPTDQCLLFLAMNLATLSHTPFSLTFEPPLLIANSLSPFPIHHFLSGSRLLTRA